MARSSLPDEAANADAIALSRALARLEPKLTQAASAAKLQHSRIDRVKTAANVEYARTLLLRREHATAQLKVQNKRRTQQAVLAQQRALLKQLTERLAELSNAADDGDSEEEGEDILVLLTPPPPSALRPVEAIPAAEEAAADESPKSLTSTSATHDRIPSPATALRARNPYGHGASDREALLGPDRDAAPYASSTAADIGTANKDALSKETATLLSSADSEQSQLTTAMLTLAAALKESAQSFAADLDADKGTVRRTEQALDKNKEGMERTAGGMARLRKMSEGRWFVTRVGMMVLIPVLWVVLLLEVFVMPKLRF